jgi:hypothetical protein
MQAVQRCTWMQHAVGVNPGAHKTCSLILVMELVGEEEVVKQ